MFRNFNWKIINIKEIKLCGQLLKTRNVALLAQIGEATEQLHTPKMRKHPASLNAANATKMYFAVLFRGHALAMAETVPSTSLGVH